MVITRMPQPAMLDPTNDLAEFQVNSSSMAPDDILDVMESFDRIAPLPVKCCPVVFLCSCKSAYHSYVCLESTVLSLMFNPELKIPDIARLKQLKERQRTELANPFNAKVLKEKSKLQDKAVEKEVVKWKPCIPVFSAAHTSSAASLALKKGKVCRPGEEPRETDVQAKPREIDSSLQAREAQLLQHAMEKSLADIEKVSSFSILFQLHHSSH